jgi:peptidoglycan/xylan/chitin deacetylase (PgdA/CDA1 family)
MPLILWSVDPRDWADHDPALVAQRVAADAKRGSIILLHDIHETTVDAVPAILDDLARRGLTPVTVSELLGDDLVAGRVYRQQ